MIRLIPKNIWPWLNVLIPTMLCALLLVLRLSDPGDVFEKLRHSILDGYHSLDQVDEYLRQLGVSDLGDLRDNFHCI